MASCIRNIVSLARDARPAVSAAPIAALHTRALSHTLTAAPAPALTAAPVCARSLLPRATASASPLILPVTPIGVRHKSSILSEDVVPSKVVQHPYITGNKKYLPGFSFPAPRKLEQIIKYALLERESPERIQHIWNEYHDNRLDCVATTWSEAEWAGIQERKRRCPRFVYPVMKGDGKFFTLVAEWQDKFCIFTFLDDYRRNPSLAEPYLSVAMYDDFLARKQLVLVRGDFSGHLRKRDAAHILNLMRYFYFSEPKYVEAFNTAPQSFDFTAYLSNCPPPPPEKSKEAGKVDRAE